MSIKSAPGDNDHTSGYQQQPQQQQQHQQQTKVKRSASSSYSAIGSLIAASSSMSTLFNRVGAAKTQEAGGDYLQGLAEEISDKTITNDDTLPSEESSPKFKTLTELVCYYSLHPITVDTLELDICLQEPVMISSSSADSSLVTKF